MQKKLYLLTNKDFRHDYDVYVAVIVCAESAEQAKEIHPMGPERWTYNLKWDRNGGPWAGTPDRVNAEFIGLAKVDLKIGLILADFTGS